MTNINFDTSLWGLKKISSFLGSRKECENKKKLSFPHSLLPLISDWDNKVKIVLWCHLSFLNNRDTFKKYWHLQSY